MKSGNKPVYSKTSPTAGFPSLGVRRGDFLADGARPFLGHDDKICRFLEIHESVICVTLVMIFPM